MSIFGNKENLTRSQLRMALSKMPTKKLNRQQRITLEKEFEKRKYGPLISKRDVKKEILEARGERFRAKTSAQKLNLNRKIETLKRVIE